MNRRDFLKKAGLAAAVTAAEPILAQTTKTLKTRIENPRWIISGGEGRAPEARELLTAMSNTPNGALIITHAEKAQLDQDFIPLEDWLQSQGKWTIDHDIHGAWYIGSAGYIAAIGSEREGCVLWDGHSTEEGAVFDLLLHHEDAGPPSATVDDMSKDL